jgi:tripeptidyl-peptidase-1
MLFPLTFVLAGAGLLGQVLGSPLSHGAPGLRKRVVPVGHKLHERHLPNLSKSWIKKSKVHGSQVLPMRIGLKQRNLQAGHDKLMEL